MWVCFVEPVCLKNRSLLTFESFNVQIRIFSVNSSLRNCVLCVVLEWSTSKFFSFSQMFILLKMISVTLHGWFLHSYKTFSRKVFQKLPKPRVTSLLQKPTRTRERKQKKITYNDRGGGCLEGGLSRGVAGLHRELIGFVLRQGVDKRDAWTNQAALVDNLEALSRDTGYEGIAHDSVVTLVGVGCLFEEKQAYVKSGTDNQTLAEPGWEEWARSGGKPTETFTTGVPTLEFTSMAEKYRPPVRPG